MTVVILVVGALVAVLAGVLLAAFDVPPADADRAVRRFKPSCRPTDRGGYFYDTT